MYVFGCQCNVFFNRFDGPRGGGGGGGRPPPPGGYQQAPPSHVPPPTNGYGSAYVKLIYYNPVIETF